MSIKSRLFKTVHTFSIIYRIYVSQLSLLVEKISEKVRLLVSQHSYELKQKF